MTGADIRPGAWETPSGKAEETDRPEDGSRTVFGSPTQEKEAPATGDAPATEKGDRATTAAPEHGGEAEPEESGTPDPGREKAHSPVDYAALAAADAEELRRTFPELQDLGDLTELRDPLRYAQLRDLGLTPAEAYLATGERRHREDNRAHLRPAISRAASAAPGMSASEMEGARQLFPDLSDSDILRLYKRIHK